MNLPPIKCGFGIVPVHRPMCGLIFRYRRRRRVCERNSEDSAMTGHSRPWDAMRRPGQVVNEHQDT
jgi:hypothetical protein